MNKTTCLEYVSNSTACTHRFLFAEQDLPLSEIAARAKATSGSGMTPATQRRGAGGVVGEEEKMREFILYNYLFVVDVKDVHDKV